MHAQHTGNLIRSDDLDFGINDVRMVFLEEVDAFRYRRVIFGRIGVVAAEEDDYKRPVILQAGRHSFLQAVAALFAE